MPYSSEAQRKFFHTNTAKKAGITEQMIEEYDKASKGKNLPKKKSKKEPKVGKIDGLAGSFMQKKGF